SRFFFFQAEDGIRGFHVTGVQTCALPILDAFEVAGAPAQKGEAFAIALIFARQIDVRGIGVGPTVDLQRVVDDDVDGYLGPDQRSEERRVGKEGRYRTAASSELRN